MSAIWKPYGVNLAQLNEQCLNTLAQSIDIQFIHIGENSLHAILPVVNKVKQPYGLLHGGASAALAETVGSVASWMCIDREKQICVGLELNCNHIRAVKDGVVTAIAEPLHIGATTHVWDIKIRDEKGRLVCVSRLTMAIRKKPK
jgi:1,4-dihydroxy-2-naphthoyl-CoA hydrolase